uniref:probable low-specificity L-threonine aldolase 2 isoform X1 n=2 Tax=Ciona intestinalis TaxID=7719 RepID=UPI000180B091|nr:probable low-specificity L-threonine aldolase 2 isoform X1 [Ciona intestinalis]|eukprot:XP_026695261.1 probable low-specificity L-threonine aldolase 2 isoform X1 [Ciona intestinalis]
MEVVTVDLRSDTLSLPTADMRCAMAEAELGDDVYGEDPTVNRLQMLAAELFGKEDALFVPTGTMGNLISVMCHCWQRGSEVLLGDQSHIHRFEQGGIAQLAGVHPKTIRNLPDGTFQLSELQAKYQTSADVHFASTSLICVENPIEGKVLPLNFMVQLRSVADELKLPIHLDGARVINAAIALGVPPKLITKYADTANICLSKGLCAPVGSVIVGSKQFITKAKRVRKLLGGGMRQAGVLAAAGIISLNVISKKLHLDHDNAKHFAQTILSLAPDLVEVNLKHVTTNIAMFQLKNAMPTKNGRTVAQEFVWRMENTSDGSKTRVKMCAFGDVTVRAVFYHQISKLDVQKALEKFELVASAWRNEL